MIEDASIRSDAGIGVLDAAALGSDGAIARRSALDWPAIAVGSAAAALLAAVSWPLLVACARQYFDPDGYYGYAPLIPAIVALMLWSRRSEFRKIEIRPSPWALIVLVPALPILVITTWYFSSSLSELAFLLIVWSSVALLLGGRFFRTAVFPLLFLITMAPLPRMLLTDFTHGLQTFSTGAAADLLRLTSFQAVVDGNVIQMQNYSLAVDVPCSGFKILLSLLTINAALAYLLDGPRANRILMFALSVPIGLAINTVRIALVGMVGDCIGLAQARVFHDWDGLIVWTVGVVCVLAIAKGMGCRTFAGWPLF